MKQYTKPDIIFKSKFKIPLITIFLAKSGGLSSKRVAGILGWLVSLVIFILGFVFQKEIPEFGDMILIMSSSLLGIDSVAEVFQKRVDK